MYMHTLPSSTRKLSRITKLLPALISAYRFQCRKIFQVLFIWCINLIISIKIIEHLWIPVAILSFVGKRLARPNLKVSYNQLFIFNASHNYLFCILFMYMFSFYDIFMNIFILLPACETRDLSKIDPRKRIPCGVAAAIYFNDSFTLSKLSSSLLSTTNNNNNNSISAILDSEKDVVIDSFSDSYSSLNNEYSESPVPLNKTDITWKSDRVCYIFIYFVYIYFQSF